MVACSSTIPRLKLPDRSRDVFEVESKELCKAAGAQAGHDGEMWRGCRRAPVAIGAARDGDGVAASNWPVVGDAS